MRSYESGHVRNLASLQKLTLLCTNFGVAYNPAPVNIKVAGLNTLYTNADNALTAVKNTKNDWKNATNAREIAFAPLSALSTQLLGILQSSGASKQTVKDFVSLTHKMRGERAKLTKADAGKVEDAGNSTQALPLPTDPPPVVAPVKHSVSQRSYDNIIEHFDKMIKLLATVPAYNPNELPLKIVTLQALLASLKTVNSVANDAYSKFQLARLNRNKFFYADETGMLDIARNVKNYVKGKFGASSQEYKSANAIRFVRVIKKKEAK